MKRWLVLACALLLGAAAPARAWCEAACIAPAAAGESHCPSHDPAADTTAISADSSDECPALESARTPASARLDLQAVPTAVHVPARVTRPPAASASAGPPSAATVFQRSIPLRI